MKKAKQLFCLLLMLTLTIALFLQPAYAAFDDVASDSWYKDAVEYADFNGLFRGISDTEFAPQATMTRGMFATVLYRMGRETSGDYPDPSFTDIVDGAYYQTPVNWGTAIGIINGVDENTFAPDAPVTREQMCKLIALFCEHIKFTLPSDKAAATFIDAGDISGYAVEYVDACQQAGLIMGYEDGSFRPQGESTRAEVATILYRLGELLEAEGFVVGPGNPSKDWRMILVNPWNYVPDGYVSGLSLKYITSYERIDSRIYDDYKAMIAAMKADGLTPYINSAFRTNSYQKSLYTNKVNQYISYGYSRSQAEVLAAQWVAKPGTSEHELGLAIDFNMYRSDSKKVHTWLENNAYKYGFIYRYQADKTEITGINPEPWHYRYVGYDNAVRITESGLCLEEYWELYG